MTDWKLENSTPLQTAAGGTLRPGGISLTEQAIRTCDFAPGSRILDAGCGTAVTTRQLSKHGQLSVFGIDRSASLLGEARNQSQKLPLVRGELEKLPFARQSFDGIICECTLSQTGATSVLGEFARVLRPGGLLILSDLYLKLARQNPLTESAGGPSLATKRQTVELLQAAHFKMTHWQDRTGDLKQLAVRLILAPGACLDNLFGWSRQSGGAQEQTHRSHWETIGYHLLIARRMAT
jgi:SAM-dependent methyltransferase